MQLCAADAHNDLSVKPATLTAVTLSDTGTAERRAAIRSKPPNVLVYCGKKDSSRLFVSMKSVLCEVLNTDQFVIYHLKHDQVLTTPWHDNASLLVIASEKVYDGIDQQFLQYFVHGGRLISFGSAFDSLLVEKDVREPSLSGQLLSVMTLQCDAGHDRVHVIGTKYCYTTSPPLLSDVTVTSLACDHVTCRPVIIEAVHQLSAGVAILSQACLLVFVSICISN